MGTGERRMITVKCSRVEQAGSLSVSTTVEVSHEDQVVAMDVLNQLADRLGVNQLTSEGTNTDNG